MATNSIQDNLRHDLDKTERVTVYLTKAERNGLEAYCRNYGISHSDACGAWVWHALKSAQYLDPSYARPTGR